MHDRGLGGARAVDARAKGWAGLPDPRRHLNGPGVRLMKLCAGGKFDDRTSHKQVFTPKMASKYELEQSRDARLKKIPGTMTAFVDEAVRCRIRLKPGRGDYVHDYIEPPLTYRLDPPA